MKQAAAEEARPCGESPQMPKLSGKRTGCGLYSEEL